MAKMYAKGDVIRGYKILQDFAAVGQCRWSFALKETEEFFIKEFLSPVYPVEGAPGSPETKARQRNQCAEFEKQHTDIMNALKGKTRQGGNLIIDFDFFLEGNRYYKVTKKITPTALSVITELSLAKKRLVLLTLANSLQILHQSAIVHGDLKPDNVLIKEIAEKRYVAKLIDFDSSYFSAKPPEEVVGDPVYYSPELGFYNEQPPEDRNPDSLQIKSDIFALGLIYHQYMTGELPDYDKSRYKYAYAAVLDGAELGIRETLPPKVQKLLRVMLMKDATTRPDVSAIIACLKEKDVLSDKPAMEKSVLTDYAEKTSGETKTSSAEKTGILKLPKNFSKPVDASAEKASAEAKTLPAEKASGEAETIPAKKTGILKLPNFMKAIIEKFKKFGW